MPLRRPRPHIAAGSRGALLAGSLASFAAAVDLARAIRPALLLSPEPSWALPRLCLGLAVIAGAASAGGIAAALLFLWSRTRAAREPLAPLALPRGALLLAGSVALLVGTFLRFAALAQVPGSLWVDDASLIPAALSLEGGPADFADPIRAVPAGVEKPYGAVGVLYLEAYRLSLDLFGTTVLGVRFPSAFAGALSLVTAGLLGRRLLPRGGGVLTALILGGLRWSLIMSRWGWCMIVLAPVLDLAALLLLAACRRRALPLALAAGAVAGLGAHVYLSAWTGAAALGAFALWPREGAGPLAGRLRIAGLFAAGFLLSAGPLFLPREGRRAAYFARTRDHNVLLEMRRQRSALPPLAAAADGLAAPWLLPDPSARNDLPGRTRLGLLLNLCVAAALCRSLSHPRRELSALLLAHAGAALAAVVAGGQADLPNGSRFAYLTTVTAVAGAAGALALTRPFRARRAAALVTLGLLSVNAALQTRDALLEWPDRRETFDAFHGQDTLIGRAAARWSVFGAVRLEPGLGHSDALIRSVWRYVLDPRPQPEAGAAGGSFQFQIAAPGTRPGPGHRVVERVRDGWGRPWAVVLGSRRSAAGRR